MPVCVSAVAAAPADAEAVNEPFVGKGVRGAAMPSPPLTCVPAGVDAWMEVDGLLSQPCKEDEAAAAMGVMGNDCVPPQSDLT